MLLGALEGGGTKMVCAIGDEQGNIKERFVVPTETPDTTMPAIADYFKQYPIEALGLASFGPIDLNKNSAGYGYITSTTKLSWRNYNILGFLKDALCIPCGFDTDVNGACLGEVSFGCMKGLSSGIYITVGTGVGVGVYCNGGLVHGMLHPEGGHVLLHRKPGDSFKGICHYHGDCLEGMCSGPAIEARAGKKAYLLDENDPIWDYESYYIAQAIVDYIMVLSPEKVVLGGGVMQQKQLFPKIRTCVNELLGAYIRAKELEDLSSYIVPASLNGDQGIMGCLKLAYDALL